ncbi:hypothetical protein JTE90_004969, partial [Oedothorax gibbosus]
KAFPPSRDPHHQRAPVFDIAPEILPKIKYETTSHSRADGSRLTTSRAHIAAGRGNTRVEKDDKRVGHAHAFTHTHSHPDATITICTIFPQNNFRRWSGTARGRTTRREAET